MKQQGNITSNFTCRYIPALAKEIGVVVSIVLLQIDYWLSKTNQVKDGHKWIYKSLRKFESELGIKKSRVNRALEKLIKEKILIIGNFNKNRWDKTHWFTIDYERVKQLHIAGLEVTLCLSQNGTAISGKIDEPVPNHDNRCSERGQPCPEIDTSMSQNGTTIPKNKIKDYKKDYTERKIETKLPKDIIIKISSIKDEISEGAWEKILSLEQKKSNDGKIIFYSKLPFSPSLINRMAELLETDIEIVTEGNRDARIK